ncbi:MAG: hypothetical protein IT416_02625 [Candidatus Pacebacteria bacterium]|nr:hypothetical protein [Candidatus Paceibacterota bacterium]
MIDYIKKKFAELAAYSEIMRQKSIAEKLLDMMWTFHYRGQKGNEFNQKGIEAAIRINLEYLPNSIMGLDIGWDKPIMRSSATINDKPSSLADLEELAKKLAAEVGIHRYIRYEQQTDGRLVRFVENTINGDVYKHDHM